MRLAKNNGETIFSESYGWELSPHKLKKNSRKKLSGKGKASEIYYFLKKENVNLASFQERFLA